MLGSAEVFFNIDSEVAATDMRPGYPWAGLASSEDGSLGNDVILSLMILIVFGGHCMRGKKEST